MSCLMRSMAVLGHADQAKKRGVLVGRGVSLFVGEMNGRLRLAEGCAAASEMSIVRLDSVMVR